LFIIWDPVIEKDTLIVSIETFKKMSFKNKNIKLHIGSFEAAVTIKSSNTLDSDKLVLSPLLLPQGGLPDSLNFDVKLIGTDLYIGPVVGILISQRNLSMYSLPQYTSKWEEPIKDFIKDKGLIFLFCEAGINLTEKNIKGIYLDEGDGKWKEATFPFPSSVFRRASVSKKMRELQKHLNGNAFNSFKINKWNLYTCFLDSGFKYTPHTTRFLRTTSIVRMLNKYGSVYLKPINGNLGKGCFKLEKTVDGYLLVNSKGEQTKRSKLAEVIQIFKEQKMKRKYIIQQSVPLYYRQKLVDYRVILQKDGSKEWTATGTITKIGMKGGIITNRVSSLPLGLEGIEKTLKLNKDDAVKLYEEMIQRCTEACEIIENKLGHLGDVGLDVIIDEHLNIWILEMNTLHNHLIVAYQSHDPHMYNRVLTKPLEYARALSGF
jgi:hypothetical protein